MGLARRYVDADPPFVQPEEPRLPRDGSGSMKTADPDILKEQAKRCRTLAEQADPHTKERLLKLAEEYERRLEEVRK